LQSFNLQDLTLLVAEALAVQSEKQKSEKQEENPTLYQLSREFGNLAFKYGDILKHLPMINSEDGCSG
jgi:hypothetical protein